jgi:hypothetical protein
MHRNNGVDGFIQDEICRFNFFTDFIFAVYAVAGWQWGSASPFYM